MPRPEVHFTSDAEFAVRLEQEAAVVMAEAEEIELLINQARTEAARHETRRQAANEKLLMAAERLSSGAGGTPKGLTELANQLVTIARKAALMEAQIDLLEGKRRSATRLSEATRPTPVGPRLPAPLPGHATPPRRAMRPRTGCHSTWASSRAPRCRRASPG